MEQGSQFHRLVQQHLMGIPEERLSFRAMTPELRQWWRAYLESSLVQNLPDRRFVEVQLTASLGKHRLTAKYDLVVVNSDGSVRIIDWKTSRRKPNRSFLEQRIQSVSILFVSVGRDKSQRRSGDQPRANRDDLLVCCPAGRTRNLCLRSSQHEANHGYLMGLIAEIEKPHHV